MIPKWLHTALDEIGIKEVSGEKDNPRILEYHSATNPSGETSDEVAWCSSLACWVFEQNGIVSTRSKAARSWLMWGAEMILPQVGCIAVLSRGKEPWMGHVGFYMGSDADWVFILGGNQNNQVCISKYDKARVIGYRWPLNISTVGIW